MTLSKNLKRNIVLGAAALGIAGLVSLYYLKKDDDVAYIPLAQEETKPLTSTQEEIKPWDIPIRYADFSKIDFYSIPYFDIDLPVNFSERLEDLTEPWNLKDKKKLERLVFEDALKLGYDRSRIETLGIKEAINFSVRIVTENFEYFLVDNDPDFLKKYGAHLPLEEYFQMGQGDCDKYNRSLVSVFKMFKKNNPKLKNVYVTEQDLGGLTQLHAWNAIVFVKSDEIVVTHIDPTFYDDRGALEAEIGYHVPKDSLEFEAKFFAGMFMFDKSFKRFEQLYADSSNTIKKSKLLGKMAYLSSQLDDIQKMDFVRARYDQLYPNKDVDSGPEHDDILYYSYKVENENGSNKKAEKFKQELLTRYESSYWAKELR